MYFFLFRYIDSSDTLSSEKVKFCRIFGLLGESDRLYPWNGSMRHLNVLQVSFYLSFLIAQEEVSKVTPDQV